MTSFVEGPGRAGCLHEEAVGQPVEGLDADPDAFCGHCGGRLTRIPRAGRTGRGATITTTARNEADRSGSPGGTRRGSRGCFADAVGDCELTATQVLAADDQTETLKRIGMKIADLTTQHYATAGSMTSTPRWPSLRPSTKNRQPADREAEGAPRRVRQDVRQWWASPTTNSGIRT